MGVLPHKAYRGRVNGPCSACGDGDTAMKYHSHDDDEKSYTLKEIEQLAERHIAIHGIKDDLTPQLFLSLFLEWLKRREKEEGGR